MRFANDWVVTHWYRGEATVTHQPAVIDPRIVRPNTVTDLDRALRAAIEQIEKYFFEVGLGIKFEIVWQAGPRAFAFVHSQAKPHGRRRSARVEEMVDVPLEITFADSDHLGVRLRDQDRALLVGVFHRFDLATLQRDLGDLVAGIEAQQITFAGSFQRGEWGGVAPRILAHVSPQRNCCVVSERAAASRAAGTELAAPPANLRPMQLLALAGMSVSTAETVAVSGRK
jgi:hypothetical protein